MANTAATARETVFTVDPVPLKYGHGALAEIGDDAKAMGMTRVGLFTDPTVAALPCFATARAALEDAGLDVAVYDHVRVEPTDASFMEAATWAQEAGVDGFVSVGGGSVMDTAKAANLLTTWPDELMAYVNAPVGRALPIPGPLKPHIACPTTSGTGSETTGVAIFDLPERQLKTGISSKLLKPRLAVVDPTATYSLPAGVVAATGFDVLTHAIESYTARLFSTRDKPATPLARPPYQGANPWSDAGALQAVRLGGTYLERAVADPDDAEAHDFLTFAATLAGMSFGNAGVHIPHAMSYAVAGLNHVYRAKGYETCGGMVPHGISVVVNAPAAFRFTADAAPERHLVAAEALGADVRDAAPEDAGEILATRLADMMRNTGLPNGLSDIGYTEDDVPALVNSAWPQQRLLAQAPKPVSEADLADLFRGAMRYW